MSDSDIGMTPNEMRAVLLLGDAWNAMIECNAANSEMAAHIHALQHALMAKMAARAYPDVFRQVPWNKPTQKPA